LRRPQSLIDVPKGHDTSEYPVHLGIDEHAFGVVMFESLAGIAARKITQALIRNVRQRSVGGDMDKKISDLFRQWLAAFEAMQVASDETAAAKAHRALSDIEARLVDTPAEGMQGLVVKLGLHCFLNEHADAASAQSDSAYRDLVRLTGMDPAVEIATRFEKEAA
jgi:hypothetical protein